MRGREPQALPAFLDWSSLPFCCPAGYSQGGNSPSEATHPSWSPGPLPAPRGRLDPALILPAQARPRLPAPAARRGRNGSASPSLVGTVQTRRTGVLERLYLGPQIPDHRPPFRHPHSGFACCPHSPFWGEKVTAGIPDQSQEADSCTRAPPRLRQRWARLGLLVEVTAGSVGSPVPRESPSSAQHPPSARPLTHQVFTPHSMGLPASADPRSGRVAWPPPPPSAPGNKQLRGSGTGPQKLRAGLGALEGSARPSPARSEVQEAGVLEASSPPDVLSVGLSGRGSEAWSQLPLPLRPVTSWVGYATTGLRLGGRGPSGPQVAAARARRSPTLPRPEACQPRPPWGLWARPTLPGRGRHPGVRRAALVRACILSSGSPSFPIRTRGIPGPEGQRAGGGPGWAAWTSAGVQASRTRDSEPSYLASHPASALPVPPPHLALGWGPALQGPFSLTGRLQVRLCRGPGLWTLPGLTRTLGC